MKLERYFSKGPNSLWSNIHIFRYLQLGEIISKPDQNRVKINTVKKCGLKICKCSFNINVNPLFKLWDHPYITSAYGLGGWVQKIAIFADVQYRSSVLNLCWHKAEFAEKGIFFANRFPSLRTFVNKKLSPPSIQFLKLIIKVVLVFLISNFFY